MRFLLLAIHDHYATGLRILTSLLHEKQYEAKMVIFKEFSLGSKQPILESEWNLLEQFVSSYNPNMIGVSMTSLHVIDEKRLFDTLRNASPNSILVCGGFGPTLEGRRFLDYGADYIVRGEGEGALLDMAKAISTGKDFKSIYNVSYIENNKVVENPLRPLSDLNNVPFGLHGTEIVFIENNTISNIDPMLNLRGMYLLSTSRGCTGRCTYCAGGNWLDLYKKEHRHIKRYRIRPTEQVISECERAKELGASYLLFLDEYFIRPEDEFFYFFSEYKKRVALPFGLMVHTSFLEKDEARFKAFFDAGVHDVEIGIQSANNRVSREVFQRKVSPETQLNTIYKLHDHWISSSVDFITGYSLESEEEFRDSLDFVKKLPFDPSWPLRTRIEAFALGLLPGARIGDLYPELQNDPMTNTEKQFRQRMLYLRHIMKDDDEFYTIYNNPFFRANPQLIKFVFDSTFFKLRTEFYQKTLSRLENKEVFFWGAGQTYQIYKHMFRRCKPLAILLDIPHDLQKIDGISILHPDSILYQSDYKTPIIIFSASPGIIASKILRNFPDYKDLIPCYNAVYPHLFLE